MPKRGQTYQYKSSDNPLSVAEQFGVTPNQLLAANPGGTPFSVGQTVNIPFQYSAQPTIQYNAPIGPQMPPVNGGGRGTMLPSNPLGMVNDANLAMRGRGYNSAPVTPALSSTYGTDDSWYRTPQQVTSAAAAQARLDTGTPAPTTQQQLAGQGALGKGDFYGYTSDPETGRSVRVIKNAASANFLNELRWDPQRKKYVSIGSLLKSGRLDLKGRWHGRRRGGGGGGGGKTGDPNQQQQDFTLANSLISFNASSG